MARNSRVFVPYGIYHVYSRVGRGEAVFSHIDEAEYWLETVGDSAKLHQLGVLAWCLMSNHYHLVLRSGPDPIWRPMARIQRRTSWNHNLLHGVRGRLWQSRYKARLIHDESYFNQVVAYVHLNPVAAGLVNDPADYRWSGHLELIGRGQRDLIDVRESLAWFGEDLASGREMYLRRIREIQEEKWLREGVRDLPWWRTVADDEQTIEEDRAPDVAVRFNGDRLVLREADPIPLSDLRRWFESAVPAARGRLSARTQTAEDCRVRRLFVLLAIVEIGHLSTEVARALHRSPSSVSRWLTTGLAQKLGDPGFGRQLERLIQRLGTEMLQQ
jgi:REP element-mobilizing transposase RayT